MPFLPSAGDNELISSTRKEELATRTTSYQPSSANMKNVHGFLFVAVMKMFLVTVVVFGPPPSSAAEHQHVRRGVMLQRGDPPGLVSVRKKNRFRFVCSQQCLNHNKKETRCILCRRHYWWCCILISICRSASPPLLTTCCLSYEFFSPNLHALSIISSSTTIRIVVLLIRFVQTQPSTPSSHQARI